MERVGNADFNVISKLISHQSWIQQTPVLKTVGRSWCESEFGTSVSFMLADIDQSCDWY